MSFKLQLKRNMFDNIPFTLYFFSTHPKESVLGIYFTEIASEVYNHSRFLCDLLSHLIIGIYRNTILEGFSPYKEELVVEVGVGSP